MLFSYLRGRDRRIKLKTSLGKGTSETLSQKQNKNKLARGMTQVECLPNICRVLGSVPSTQYLQITFTHPSINLKSSLHYLQCLI
jgi:hypothetical protein